MGTTKLPSLTKKQFNTLECLKINRDSNISDASCSDAKMRQTIRSLYNRGLIFAEGRCANPNAIVDPSSISVTHFTNINITTRGMLLLNAYKHKENKSEHIDYWAKTYSDATKEVA
jgi:hypothetical protein